VYIYIYTYYIYIHIHTHIYIYIYIYMYIYIYIYIYTHTHMRQTLYMRQKRERERERMTLSTRQHTSAYYWHSMLTYADVCWRMLTYAEMGSSKEVREREAFRPTSTFDYCQVFYICLYVHKCICMYVCMYLYMYVCMYIYIYILCVCVCVCVYTDTYRDVDMRWRIRLSTSSYYYETHLDMRWRSTTLVLRQHDCCQYDFRLLSVRLSTAVFRLLSGVSHSSMRTRHTLEASQPTHVRGL
jgi:hypothetical protein